MDRSDIKKTIDQEIERTCREKSVDFHSLNLNEEFNLLQSGLFDSLGILQLITLLEDEFGVTLDLSEYSPAEFTNYMKLIEILEADNKVTPGI
jgi:acyl carrier protein